jgi:hypothetical protein
MGSKFIRAVKCVIRRPVDSVRLALGSYESRPVESIKVHCPEVEVESFGFYAGLFLATLFVVICVITYLFFYALRAVYVVP